VKQVGTIGRARLVWSFGEIFAIEAGALGRLPFAENIKAEAGALPILAFVMHPFSSELTLRIGSLDIDHGYHPAVVDEARYAYGRDYQTSYNRSLVAAAQKDLGGDPFMPAEHGLQIIGRTEAAKVEGFLDWQLLETAVHREKFAVGLLGSVDLGWVRSGIQFRLVHYGGMLFTRSDPIRFAGLDPVRQPITGLLSAAIVPPIDRLGVSWLKVELPFAYVHGRMIQTGGGAPEDRSGAEGGADVFLFDVARLGYRLFVPIAHDYGFVSEDADPVYAERRSHRVITGLSMKVGPATVDSRLDLVFADDAQQVQFELFTVVRFMYEAPVF
jgi:hypothetical protein